MGRIIITGGTGLIGSRLATDLAAAGNEIIVLARHPERGDKLPTGVRAVGWDGKTATGWGALADGADAIINLAGASIGRPPWTESYKAEIRSSRVDAGRAVIEAVRAARVKPQVLVQSSAVGYYGLHEGELVTESTPPGTDFLAQVCVEWENSTAEVETMGVRRVITRSGIVLSKSGGILSLIALPFRFFVGGPVGNGWQWWSWIHLADESAAVRFLLENDSTRGAYNLAAPNPATSAQFARAIARTLNRPALLPAPAFAMKLALGEMADLLLLGGQRVVPERLTQLGFHFRYPELDGALRNLLG